jgi:hypothetical protein
MPIITAAGMFLLGIAVYQVLRRIRSGLLANRRIEEHREPLSFRLLVAGVFGLSFGGLSLVVPHLSQTLYPLTMLSLCWLVADIDLRYRIIPNQLVMAIFLAAIGFSLAGLLPVSITDSLLAFSVLWQSFSSHLFWAKRSVPAM